MIQSIPWSRDRIDLLVKDDALAVGQIGAVMDQIRNTTEEADGHPRASASSWELASS